MLSGQVRKGLLALLWIILELKMYSCSPEENLKLHKEEYNINEFVNVENEEDYVNEYTVVANLPDCSAKERTREPIVILSTIDGRITGLSQKDGRILWSQETGAAGSPLVESSLSSLEIQSEDGKWTRLIPSLEGGIFRFDGDSLESLPFTAESLLHSSFKFNEEAVFTGGKFSELLGLLPLTGEVRYTCGSSGCPTKSDRISSQILVVKKVSHTVRCIDPTTGNERWNFSVGQHDLNVANTECESSYDNVELKSLPNLKFILPDGLTLAVDRKGQNILWQRKLKSSIVGAWSLVNGDLNTIDLFSAEFVPALLVQNLKHATDHSMKDEDTVLQYDPNKHGKKGQSRATLYIGVHNEQLYVQKNINTELKFKDVQRFMNKDKLFQTLKVDWVPYEASALSKRLSNQDQIISNRIPDDEENRVDEKPKTEVAIRNDLDLFTEGSGYFLFGKDEDYSRANWSAYPFAGLNFEEDEQLWSEAFYNMCFVFGPAFWWASAVGLAAYFLVHFVAFKYIVRIVINNVERTMNRRIMNAIRIILHNIMREHPQLLAIIQKVGLNIPPILPSDRKGSVNYSEFENQDSKFVSRYLTDFEPLSCLGQGGFGVVFHVRNRLDQNEYAVKRIVLPTMESSAERVKREVRALAKLNHPRIVRYYNSWLETPPVGWQSEADAWWMGGDAASSVFTHDRTTSVDTRAIKDSKKSDSRDENGLTCPTNESSLCHIVKKIHPLQGDFEDKEFFDGNSVSITGQRASDLVLFKNNRESKFYVKESFEHRKELGKSSKKIYDKPSCETVKPGCETVKPVRKFIPKPNRKLFRKTDLTLPGNESRDSLLSSDSSDMSNTDGYFSDDSGSSLENINDRDRMIKEDIYNRSAKDDSIEIVFQNDHSDIKKSQAVKSLKPSFEKVSSRKRRTKSERVCNEKENKNSEVSTSRPSSLLLSRSFNTGVEFKPAEVSHQRWVVDPLDFKKKTSSCFLNIGPQTPDQIRATSIQMSPDTPTKDNMRNLDSKSITPANNSDILPVIKCLPKTYLYIQMELCHKESLKEWLFNNPKRDINYIYSLFNDIVHAVEYVHDRSLMHRDLKPSNIFFSLDGEIKIGDFGLVTTIEEEDVKTPVKSAETSIFTAVGSNSRQRTLNAGTHLYMSPEQMTGQNYTYKVDIFSLGLILFEMLMPFSTEMERRIVMMEARGQVFPAGFQQEHPEIFKLLEIALNKDPAKRPTTRGLRSREPFSKLQNDLESICSEEHFHLKKNRHIRSQSGSFSSFYTSSTSS